MTTLAKGKNKRFVASEHGVYCHFRRENVIHLYSRLILLTRSALFRTTRLKALRTCGNASTRHTHGMVTSTRRQTTQLVQHTITTISTITCVILSDTKVFRSFMPTLMSSCIIFTSLTPSATSCSSKSAVFKSLAIAESIYSRIISHRDSS
jgi:hypothetical protein